MKLYKIQNRSQKHSHSCVHLSQGYLLKWGGGGNGGKGGRRALGGGVGGNWGGWKGENGGSGLGEKGRDDSLCANAKLFLAVFKSFPNNLDNVA
jgi:hypothetical protein